MHSLFILFFSAKSLYVELSSDSDDDEPDDATPEPVGALGPKQTSGPPPRPVGRTGLDSGSSATPARDTKRKFRAPRHYPIRAGGHEKTRK